MSPNPKCSDQYPKDDIPSKDTVATLFNVYSLADKVNGLKLNLHAEEKDQHYNDLPIERHRTNTTRNCGIYTEVRKILQPPPKSRFEEFDCVIRESIYKSNKNEPLGKERCGLQNLKRGQTYGMPTKSSIPLYEIILPWTTKGRCNVVQRHIEEIDLNAKIMAHGQRLTNSTSSVAACLNWLQANICVINDVQGELWMRSKPVDGMVLEPIKNRLNVSENFSYGKPSIKSGETVAQRMRTDLGELNQICCPVYERKV